MRIIGLRFYCVLSFEFSLYAKVVAMPQRPSTHSMTLFETRGLPVVSVCPNGRFIAAYDAWDNLYLFDSAARRVVVAQMQIEGLARFDFDRSGQRLFLNDTDRLLTVEAPSMRTLPNLLGDVLEEPWGLSYRDSATTGELLVLENETARLYLQDAALTRSRVIAALPRSEIGAWFVDGTRRILLSTYGAFGICTEIEVPGSPGIAAVPPMENWREAAVIAVADDSRRALRWADELSVENGNGEETCRCRLPAELVNENWLLDPGLSLVAVLCKGRLFAFDARTGALLDDREDATNPVTSVRLFCAGGGVFVVCGLLSGSVVQWSVAVQ